ncbi:hypothetical protein F5Y07DRAFT_175387 [Xylaria sp. FL0933]|nr:hypothetical protein F5Y07DRAFT_175387 [Xylaria sp. FL0933]
MISANFIQHYSSLNSKVTMYQDHGNDQSPPDLDGDPGGRSRKREVEGVYRQPSEGSGPGEPVHDDGSPSDEPARTDEAGETTRANKSVQVDDPMHVDEPVSTSAPVLEESSGRVDKRAQADKLPQPVESIKEKGPIVGLQPKPPAGQLNSINTHLQGLAERLWITGINDLGTGTSNTDSHVPIRHQVTLFIIAQMARGVETNFVLEEPEVNIPLVPEDD